jgi:hypothetical protein
LRTPKLGRIPGTKEAEPSQRFLTDDFPGCRSVLTLRIVMTMVVERTCHAFARIVLLRYDGIMNVGSDYLPELGDALDELMNSPCKKSNISSTKHYVLMP